MPKKNYAPTFSGEDALNLARKGKDAWNKWAEEHPGIHIGFDGADLTPGKVGKISFNGFTFPGPTGFSGATLSDGDFRHCTFTDDVWFMGTTFDGTVDFSQAVFKKMAYFGSATFVGFSSFSRAIFCEAAEFHLANFKVGVMFAETNFENPPNFKKSTINGALFESVTFKMGAYFDEVTFSGSTEFIASRLFNHVSFSGATFTGPVSLEGCRFERVPDFRRCQFGKHVTLFGIDVEFHTPVDGDADKYRRLKEIAVNARDHDREQFFFACELKAKRGHETTGWALIPNYLYEWTSDFGRSLLRPAIWLGGIWVGFAISYLSIACKGTCDLRDGLLFSAAQLFPFLGASKGILEEAKTNIFGSVQAPFSGWVSALAILEGFLGIAFLFLIGLALRNRFRI